MTPPGPAQPRGPGRPRDLLIALALIVAAVIVTLFVVALFDDEEDPAARDLGVTIDDVMSNPQQYVDHRVIVSGEVTEQLTTRAFMLGSDGLLVVDPSERAPEAGAIAQIDGVVRHGGVNELVEEFGLSFDEAALDALGEEPVTALVARSVLINPAGLGLEQQPTVTPTAITAIDRDRVFALPEVLARFEELEGETVTVAGQVGIAYSPHVSSVSGVALGTDNLLLVSRDVVGGGFLNLISARVTGTATRFDREAIERELGIDLDDALVDQFAGEPALIVDSVHFFPAGPRLGAALLDIPNQRVTATGTITTVYSEQIFTLDDNEVIVVSATPVGDEIVEEALAVVTGTSALFSRRELPPEATEALGALSNDEIDDLEGQPMIFAESVSVTR